jgi:hypothetical protein
MNSFKVRWINRNGEKVLQELVTNNNHGGNPETFWRDVPVKDETDERDYDGD